MKFRSSVVLLLFPSFLSPLWAQVNSKQTNVKPAASNVSPALQQPASPVSKGVSVPNASPVSVTPAAEPVASSPSASSALPHISYANKTGNITLVWGAPLSYQPAADATTIQYLNLSGGRYEPKDHYLPEFYEWIELSSGSNKASADVVNLKFEPLTQEETKALGNNAKWVPKDISPKLKTINNKNQFYLTVSFIPVRKNPTTGTYEKVVSFSLNLHQAKQPVKAGKPAVTFASYSVLSSGTWLRVGVTADGIYQLNSAFFLKAGVDTSKLAPGNIRVYGNGGGMLPQSNAVYRPDDLLEDAIYVQGQGDRSFKKNDYILFYGQGPNVWTYDSTDKHFHHTVNLYSDTTFYFVNIDATSGGKGIGNEALASGIPTNTVTTFDDYAYHELDGVNLIQSGYEWMGEVFETNTQYNFSFPFPNISNSGAVYVQAVIASRICAGNGVYQVSSGSANATVTIGPVLCQFDTRYANIDTGTYTYIPAPNSSNVPVTITKQTPSAIGWVYHVETNVRRGLALPGGQNQMEFRDTKSAGQGNTSLFSISSLSRIQVWDITDPQNIDSIHLSPSGGNYNFEVPTNTLRQYITFTNRSGSFLTPVYFGRVGNQNLHALPQADMLIVTNPLFIQQAEQLANFHEKHDNLKVNVVTTQQVYNEFSSGAQDVTGIRDFVRMFYDRSTNYANSPKYLLLFGGGSYDPKHRTSGNTNYVVAYESANSIDPIGSYVSDDYFVLLDSTVTTAPEATNVGYLLDLSVGRFAVDNTAEAQACVNKVMIYENPTGQSVASLSQCCNTQNQYTLGNWRNNVCFIAHDGSENAFETASESMSNTILVNFKTLNVNKIYADAYQMVQTPGGPRYPEVNVAIDNQMNQGLLVYNFEGHGGPTGLGFERILDFSDINTWNNLYALPLFFNGSCAFSEWDNPLQISGGQLSVNLPSGGVIGMVSATRGVYLQQNVELNQVFIDSLYAPLPDGSLPRIGDILTMTKNSPAFGLTGSVNNLSYSLLGDPAVRLAYPKYNIHTSSVTTSPASHDTLKALDKVTISGYVTDSSGKQLTSFNGLLYPTVCDKPVSITTLANLGGCTDGYNPTGYGPSCPLTFQIQNSELFKGLVTVNNGAFTFTYVMPKDILYYYGPGKISYYAENGKTDAAGNYQNIIVGGTSPLAHNNGVGPKVRLYMNDSNFVYGGITNENPSLFAVVFDSNGINTSVSSIGHNITAVLDNNTANTYDLTNYYEPSLNSYQKGTITFPFSSLSNGTHTLSLRVWNVYDNTSVSTTEFNVEPQSSLQLQHVLNYPNPFTTHTQFYFEINEVCDQMDVQIQIFSVSGKLVRNILTSVKTQSFRSDPIDWDGRDDYGDRIARGVYIYHLRVRTSTGQTASTYQKVVIL